MVREKAKDARCECRLKATTRRADVCWPHGARGDVTTAVCCLLLSSIKIPRAPAPAFRCAPAARVLRGWVGAKKPCQGRRLIHPPHNQTFHAGRRPVHSSVRGAGPTEHAHVSPTPHQPHFAMRTPHAHSRVHLQWQMLHPHGSHRSAFQCGGPAPSRFGAQQLSNSAIACSYAARHQPPGAHPRSRHFSWHAMLCAAYL